MRDLSMSANLENETQELLGKVVQDFTGAIATRMCAIGIDLGLFVDLAENGASTSQEIAERKAYQERYVREWVYGTHKVGYLNFDKETRKASLSNAAINVLVSKGEKFSQQGAFKLINNMMLPYDELLSSFEKGGGVQFEDYRSGLWEGLDLTGCTRYRSFLVTDWTDKIPEITAKLEKGVTFADFGCGTGRSSIELAKKYPNSRYFGFDVFPPNIEKAKENASERGVSDICQFQVWDAKSGAPGQFDIVAAFDLIHDLPHPGEGIQAIKNAMKDNGLFLLMDIKCTEDPIDNEGPMTAFKFGASLHFCMTTSLAHDGEGLGTVGLPESKVKELCFSAGFKTVKEIEINHPLNSLFIIE